MLIILIYTSIAGVIGTTLGGLIGIMFGKVSNKITGLLLSFAGGIMLAIVFFDLIPESTILSNVLVTFMGVLWAIIILWILDYFINQHTLKKKNNFINIQIFAQNLNAQNSTLKFKTLLSNLNNKTKKKSDNLQNDNYLRLNNSIGIKHNADKSNNETIKSNKKNNQLYRTGLIIFMAIAIHNFPEGMAIGTLGAVDNSMSLTLSILICLHNIPEGMAISVPIIAGGGSKKLALLLSIISGSITIFGGILGLILGSINSSITAFSLALAGGAMLYVTTFEIIPETIELTKSKSTHFVFCIGILLGLLLITFI